MKRWPLFVEKLYPRLNFQIDSAACLLGALALLILPLNWLAAAVIAAGVHEACHLIALKLCGCRLAGFSVGSSGAIMETEPVPPASEVICALAGPAGSLTLLLLARWIPHIALCAAVQGIFNLLPVFPLDGGRIIRGLLQIWTKNGKWEKAAYVIEGTTVGLFGMLGIYCTVALKFGCLPLILVAFVLMRVFLRKIPCKEAQLAVQ